MIQLDLHENDIATAIVDIAFRMHVKLGPGMLESVYESAMAYEFDRAGIRYLRQYGIPVKYDAAILPNIGFRLDFLVESKVVVELKSVEHVLPVHFATTLTYLKQTNTKLGLLINFNTSLIKDGIHRIVNGL
jgi:GxxExxY protein